MEIFNIHIFEFLLIAALALVVFGPERLPEIGRFLGRQLAKLLAWQQQSPEVQVINEVRNEFEREIASLRDELVRTRNQLDVSRSMSIESIREELKPMLNLREELNGALKGAQAAASATGAAKPAVAEPTIAPPRTSPEPAGDPALAPTAGAQAADLPGPSNVAAPQSRPAIEPTAAANTVPSSTRPNKLAAVKPASVLNQPPATVQLQADQSEPVTPADDPSSIAAPPSALSDEERLQIEERLLRLVGELQALVAELQERGLLGPEWQSQATISNQEAASR